MVGKINFLQASEPEGLPCFRPCLPAFRKRLPCAITVTSTTAFITPSASIVFSSVTLTTAFDACLIYNSSQSNKAVSVHTFGSQTVTAGTFTLTMPTNDSSTGLIRLA